MDTGSETNSRVLKKPSTVMGQPTLPPSTSDGDYVWDVFYHRPATLSEWNEVANVGTLSVVSISLFQNPFTPSLFSGLDFPLHSELFTILLQIRKKRKKMKQMKILTVSGLHLWLAILGKDSSASHVAEEYYKNDYPDEIDSSESSGKRLNPCYMALRHVFFSRRIP